MIHELVYHTICGTAEEHLRFLERERDREWWCLELLGDLDESIVCFL